MTLNRNKNLSVLIESDTSGQLRQNASKKSLTLGSSTAAIV